MQYNCVSQSFLVIPVHFNSSLGALHGSRAHLRPTPHLALIPPSPKPWEPELQLHLTRTRCPVTMRSRQGFPIQQERPHHSFQSLKVKVFDLLNNRDFDKIFCSSMVISNHYLPSNITSLCETYNALCWNRWTVGHSSMFSPQEAAKTMPPEAIAVMKKLIAAAEGATKSEAPEGKATREAIKKWLGWWAKAPGRL